MGLGLRKTLAACGMTVTVLFVTVPSADAALILAASADGDDICAVDNDAFACTWGTQVPDADPALGSLALGDTGEINVGGLLVSGSVHTSTFGPPNNILNSTSLDITNPTDAAITAMVAVGATDFTPPSFAFSASGSGTWQQADGSIIDLVWYNDPANQQGAETPTDFPGNLVFTCSDLAEGEADSFACSESGPLLVPDLNPFSMTLGFDFTLEPGGVLLSRGQTLLKPVEAAPEPALLTLLGLGFCAAGARLRRRV